MADAFEATVIQRKKPPTVSPVGGAPAGDPEHGSQPTSHATRRLTVTNPAESMRADEILRTRIFLRVVLGLLAGVGLILPFLGGDPTAKRILVGAMIVTAVACGGYLVYIRDETRYSPQSTALPAAVTVLAAMTGVNYFGFYSPAPMILTFGVYFISLGGSRLSALGSYASVALLQGAGSLLIAFDVMADRGLIRVGDLDRVDRLFIIVAEQFVLFITFMLGRLSRGATLTAMEKLETAIRQVNQREALLQEARLDLEQALKAGPRGRYTGETVGHWKLGEILGRGAMGEVYEATHAQKGTLAALKLLHAQVESEPEQIKRFLREAEVMSQLDSPHVVKVFDVGFGADGPPYIAMERLRGLDLARHLRKRRRLSPARVVELITQVANALEGAREREIVHRDLKPQNLFLCEGEPPTWKILDFGVSKLGAKGGTLTRGHVIGTPGYMAPEQARGVPADHRADVFSLAVIAYRCLTGRPAFAGEEYPKIMFDLVYVQPARPSELVNLPIDVDFALAIGLAKDPKDRYPGARELADALRLALEGALPPELATRGHQLVARHPWGGRAVEDVDLRTPPGIRRPKGID